MKDLFISDLRNQMGKEVSLIALLKNVEMSQNRKKDKWQEMTIADKSGEITIRAWAELMQDKYFDLIGKVVKVLGMVSIYQNKVEIQIIAMDEVMEYEWTDLAMTVEEQDAIQYCNQLNSYIQMVNDPCIKALLEKIFDKGRINKIALSIGGSLHHNYYGGLLVHIVDTCSNALQTVDNRQKSISPYRTSVNRDLVIAGALLHDVGKLNSYGGFPNGVRTTRGMLVNSSVESVLFATMFNSKLPVDLQVKDLGPLDHIILTAETMDDKGQYPRTLEAVIVNKSNNESVKLDGFEMSFHEYDRQLNDHKTSLYSKINKTTIFREV
jgi:3'-5' exoribonuclease